MGVFEFMVGRKKPTPGEVAKERLKVVLVHDRLKLNPELLELIKSELVGVLSRRLEVDEQQMQLSLTREGGWDKLLADVPVKRQKVSFEWDPPSYTPSSDVLRGKLHVEESEVQD
ncbi:cell division topological specificity factor MinE [Ktedonosporobacter rubrisoli]|uniref:Cell division topological specificity factor n=1 Tax=Ktedonosporobacter rubrisoli TaxID=2509675 RepID=A0A4P6JZ56_KTERU|nr:cell division topological specificity factor MinE [Ktedonosporobacter rubrisoli]QBD80875.1 cell division topological specificity factor MinE [Ktedonosporobacter rubrisoli]